MLSRSLGKENVDQKQNIWHFNECNNVFCLNDAL